jgi:hypothetical protein
VPSEQVGVAETARARFSGALEDQIDAIHDLNSTQISPM